MLNELGLKPDGIVGHSVGELGCAYADGCFTAEQMVLAAYWRGKAVEDSNLQEGAMAALGMSFVVILHIYIHTHTHKYRYGYKRFNIVKFFLKVLPGLKRTSAVLRTFIHPVTMPRTP